MDKTFTWFIYLLGSTVVGCDNWRRERTTKRLSEILTVSDEAFIVLTFINNQEKWEFWWKKMVRSPRSDPTFTTWFI